MGRCSGCCLSDTAQDSPHTENFSVPNTNNIGKTCCHQHTLLVSLIISDVLHSPQISLPPTPLLSAEKMGPSKGNFFNVPPLNPTTYLPLSSSCLHPLCYLLTRANTSMHAPVSYSDTNWCIAAKLRYTRLTRQGTQSPTRLPFLQMSATLQGSPGHPHF